MIPGLLGALTAAVAYGAATILQAVGVRRLAGRTTRRSLTDTLRAGWPYAAGLGLDGLGFLASVAALRTLPLFLVESAIASSVAVTAVLSVIVLHVRLRRAEVVALGAVCAGLVALALGATEGEARPGDARTAAWLLAAAALVGLLLALGLLDPVRARGSVVLSVAAGLGFGGVGVAARTLPIPSPWWHVLDSPTVWVLRGLILHAVLATVAYGFALARGRVTTVAAITFATETVVPAVIGLVWLGDGVRPGWAPLALAGFVLTLGGCIMLAGRAEPAEASDAAPAHAGDPGS